MLKLIAAAIVSLVTTSLLATAPADAAVDLHPNRDRVFIIAAGDSITDGAGAEKGESWPEVLQRECGDSCKVRNRGHGASCLVTEGCAWGKTLSETFNDEVLALDPDEILVGIGRNDLCRSTTRAIVAGFKDLRARARAAGVGIRFATITPASAAWPWPCEDQRIEVNRWLRTLPGTLDFETRTSTPHGLLLSQFDFGDGLHMNARGYDVLGRMVARAVGPRIRQLEALRS